MYCTIVNNVIVTRDENNNIKSNNGTRGSVVG
jgi:hypothetical protein